MSQTRRADSAPEHKSGQKKRDLLLLAVLLAAAALLFAGREFFAGRPAVMVSVWVDGAETMTLDLNQDDDIVIENGNGQTNHLIIEDGKAFLTEASCPDKLCVRQGAISETGQTIACAPNRVSITIVGTK